MIKQRGFFLPGMPNPWFIVAALLACIAIFFYGLHTGQARYDELVDRIAADNARFAFHEMRFGVYPYGGGLFRFIRAAGWNAAMRYSLTSEEFGVDEALRMKVVAQVRPVAEAEAAGVALAQQICKAAPLAVQAALAQAQTWANSGDAAAFAHSVPDIVRLLNSRDAAEAMRALTEGRTPEFSGQ